MAGQENPLQIATRVFDQSIYGIRDSHIGGISETARKTVDKIRKQELLVVANNQTFKIPTIIGFDLTEVVPEPRTYYAPAIVLDIGKILSSRPDVIAGDLVRTLAIAEQYPFNGFQRRYREVYSDALEVQKEWLKKTVTPDLPLDPRLTEKETLLRKLIGDARYFSDVGFVDWQRVIEEYRASGQDVDIFPLLDQLKDATGHFLVMRQRFVPMNHRIATQRIGEEYLTQWSAEKRSESMAYALMGTSIYARQPDN